MTPVIPTHTPDNPGSLTLRRARAAVFALFMNQ